MNNSTEINFSSNITTMQYKTINDKLYFKTNNGKRYRPIFNKKWNIQPAFTKLIKSNSNLPLPNTNFDYVFDSSKNKFIKRSKVLDNRSKTGKLTKKYKDFEIKDNKLQPKRNFADKANIIARNYRKYRERKALLTPVDSAFNSSFEVYTIDMNLGGDLEDYRWTDELQLDEQWITPVALSPNDVLSHIQNTDIFHQIKQVLRKVLRDGPKKIFPSFKIKVFFIQSKDTKVFTKSIKARICNTPNDFFKYLFESISQLMENGDYSFTYKIEQLFLSVSKYNAITGSSYKPIPESIKNKKAIVNIKNDDKFCFIWSVLASMYPVKDHPERVSKYTEHFNKLKFNEKDFPMEVNGCHILKFEKDNELCIHIYTSNPDGKDIRPLRISNQPFEKIIQLFYYDNHYSYIKNFNRFCGSREQQSYNCPRCLKSFRLVESLNEHLEDCRNLNVKQKVKLPEQDVNDKLKFTGFQKQNKKPIVLYADFESINSKNPKTNSNTSKDTKHLPTSYMIFIKSDIDLNIPLTYKYKGLDANEHFVKTIMKIESHLKFKIKEAKGIWGDTMKPLSPTQQDHHNTCNTCRFCNQQIKTNKVRDHCHYTGNYRGPAHEECNLKASCPKRETIPIMFHNLNYDLRMIIQALIFWVVTKIELK